MNVKTANRLADYRKANKLSQEDLAEKIGVSRQAISKWERSEASPDTDNLILLARLYGISLDELLDIDSPVPPKAASVEPDFTSQEDRTSNNTGAETNTADKKKTYVHIGKDGIHVEDGKSNVHISMAGIHVEDYDSDDNDDDDSEDEPNNEYNNNDSFNCSDEKCCHNAKVIINGVPYDNQIKQNLWKKLPISLLTVIAFLTLGVVGGWWHPAWMLFFIIPLYESLWQAIKHKNANNFAYPVFAAAGYLCLGFFANMWHPGWIIFLTIPLYYSLVNMFKHK